MIPKILKTVFNYIQKHLVLPNSEPMDNRPATKGCPLLIKCRMYKFPCSLFKSTFLDTISHKKKQFQKTKEKMLHDI